ADASDPVQNYLTIENELRKYDQDLADKPRLLAVNKMDLLPEGDRDKIVKEFLNGIDYDGKVFNISALNGLGCKDLVYGLFQLVEEND
ncbi:MAG TPA: GTPase ObgE, partial [Gammaproteobacteria bacterium]|nr:GTPase ObgE [Gammaproteobacteria bacterium]